MSKAGKCDHGLAESYCWYGDFEIVVFAGGVAGEQLQRPPGRDVSRGGDPRHTLCDFTGRPCFPEVVDLGVGKLPGERCLAPVHNNHINHTNHIGTNIHSIHNQHFRTASTNIINCHITVRLIAHLWRLETVARTQPNRTSPTCSYTLRRGALGHLIDLTRLITIK